MDCKDFLQGIMWTKQQWTLAQSRRKLPYTSSYEYLTQKSGINWLHLETMGANALSNQIVTGFLNTAEWNCHLPGPNKPEHVQMVANLKGAVDKLPPYYAALKNFKIYDLNFFGIASLGKSPVPISLVIAEVYATFCAIAPRFGPVPASKLMHMALRELFVMWDNAIIKGYHVPSYPSDKPQYLPFLVLMQENARHIKQTDPAESNVTWADFLGRINQQCGYKGLSMARLLDIANYAVGHPKRGAPKIKCDTCCESANRILDQLESHINPFQGVLGRFRC